MDMRRRLDRRVFGLPSSRRPHVDRDTQAKPSRTVISTTTYASSSTCFRSRAARDSDKTHPLIILDSVDQVPCVSSGDRQIELVAEADVAC